MTTILIVADTHINSTVALCPPHFELDDQDKHGLSYGQMWLWDKWQELISLAARVDDLITVFNGDIAEGDSKYRSHQLITRNRAVIKRMAAECLEPLVKQSKAAYLIRGTSAHGGKSGAIEEDIADDLQLTGPSENVHSWWQLPLLIGNVKFDIAHTINGGGGLPWNRQNAASNLAARTMMDYTMRGEAAPKFVIRSHIHRMGDSYDAYPTRALITPAWTLPTEYVTKIAPSALADIGAIFIHLEGDCTDVWKFNPRPLRRTWILPKMTC